MEWKRMWEKPKMVITTRKTSPIQIMIDKTPGECGFFHKMHMRFQCNTTIVI